ncbi:hypothetical protein ACOMHN_007242 [Nucella lapillus]
MTFSPGQKPATPVAAAPSPKTAGCITRSLHAATVASVNEPERFVTLGSPILTARDAGKAATLRVAGSDGLSGHSEKVKGEKLADRKYRR